jgi:predicted DNA-binding helix-hairpin-helix protein
MGRMRERIDEARAEGRRFSPAGQSTQLVVGADEASDETVLRKSASLYRDYDLKRIYYSGGRKPGPPRDGAAAPARAPALPSRLADAELRLRHR